MESAKDEPNLTDVGNAQRFIARHGHDLRYVAKWTRWLHWNGRCWEDDFQLEAEARFKETLSAMYADLGEIYEPERRKKLFAHIMSSEKASRVRGGVELARSEPGIAIQPDDLDTDPFLLNLNNCTYDLAAESPKTHNRKDLLTKTAPVDYIAGIGSPVWDGFLETVLPDPEIRRYIQQLVGYSLTAETGEQILPILYGSGSNGKSTFNETIKYMLGDYAQVAPASTFLDQREGIPNDIARLRSTRFVIASELNEGKRLNEALVKRLTGGDTIVARFMRGEFFEFQPTFKAWLSTNHKPDIRGTDEAIWRRVRLIPFTVTIPPEQRDNELKEKLRLEVPGILNWAIAGYLDWRANQLQTPTGVRAATLEYRAESDTIGSFITDRCHPQPEGWVRNGEIYDAYASWSRHNQGDPMSPKAFTQRMNERGYKQSRTPTARIWVGLELNEET